MPDVNFGLLDTSLPGRIAGIPQDIQQNQMRNALQAFQLQQAGNQNELARYQINAARRADMESEQFRNALAGADFSTPEARATAIANVSRINPKLGFDLAKQFREQEKGALEVDKTRAEIEKLRQEQQKRHREALHEAFRSGALNPTDEAVRRITSQVMQMGMPMQEATALQNELMALPPEQRSMRLASFGAAAADLMKQVAPEIKQIQTPGGGLDFMQFNPNLPSFGQRPQGVQAMPAQMTPYEKARLPLEQQRVGLEGQRVGLEGRRVALAEQQATPEAQQAKLASTLSTKDIQSRESAFPQANLAVKSFEADSDALIKELSDLKKSKGLGGITGIISGNTPAITAEARAAKALFDSILAKGQFNSLQALRNSSPTGGALGNVSDKEGQALRDAFGALSRSQDTKDFQKQLENVIDRIKSAKQRTREAFDLTYEYRAPKKETSSLSNIRDEADRILSGK